MQIMSSRSSFSLRALLFLGLAEATALGADSIVFQVRGFVLDPASAPVRGAKVRFAPDREALDSWLETTTDDSGAYTIDVTRAGAQGRVEFSHDGFATTRIDKTPPISPLLALPPVLLLRPVALSGAVTTPDGKPLVGAVVRALLERDELRLTDSPTVVATTDETGGFELQDLPPARVRIEVAAKGHFGYGEWLDLRGAPSELAFDFTLHPGAELRGRIVDAAGAPLPGVRIARAGGGSALHETTTSGKDGVFTLGPGRDPAEFVSLRLRGHAPQRIAVGALANGDIVYPPGHRLQCSLAAKDGAAPPIVGVHYDVFTKQGEGWKHEDGDLTLDDAEVDGAGTWTVGLPVGERARIRVRSADGRDSAPIELDLTRVIEGGFKVTFELPSFTRVRGVVKGPTDQPVAGVRVEIGQPNESSLLPRAARATTTDANGEFRFDGVLPGAWSVVAADATAISPPQLIGVAAGQEPPPVQLAAVIAARAEGKVTVNGEPPRSPIAVVGMRYQRIGAGGKHVVGVATHCASDGAYSLAPLARGAYVVAAIRSPEAIDGAWHEYPSWLDALDVKDSPNRVTVLDTAALELDVPLTFIARGTLRGLVTVNGEPRGGARIAIRRKSMSPLAAPLAGGAETLESDSKGAYRAVLEGGGTYEIALMDGALRKGFEFEYEAGADRTLALAVEAGGVFGRFVPQTTTEGQLRAVLEGEITPEEDQIRRANPSNVDDTPWVSRAEAIVEADGTFAFPEIAAGRYRVAFEDLSRTLARVASEPFALGAGQRVTVPNLVVPPAATLALVLSKAESVTERLPFASAKVTAADGAPPLPRTFVGWFVGSEAKIDGLPPSKVKVELIVFGKWKQPAPQTIEIAPGATPTLEFAVKPRD
jgi:Carboxypeptidase regulatory-like domain